MNPFPYTVAEIYYMSKIPILLGSFVHWRTEVRYHHLIIVLLIVSTIVSSLVEVPIAEGAGGSFGGGDGSAGNPYVIEDVWDLQNINDNLTAHYVLGNDIDAFVTRDWNSGAGFRPIGASGPDFRGTLDGRNHTITGLCIGSESNPNNVGLFATVGPGGLIRDVKLAEVNVAGYSYVGGFAGDNKAGTISNCHVTGNVTASWSQAGGLIGINRGTVDRSHFAGRVQAEYMAGGLAGSHRSGVVNNSYFEGTVTSPVNAGGLVTTYYLRGKVVNSHYNIDEVIINGGLNVTIGGLFDAQYQDWFSNGLALDISDYRATLVPSGSWFEVSTVHGWRDLLGFAGVERLRFRLATDLNLSGAPGLFVPYLASEFDGANHTVSGLRINSPSTSCTGVFGFNARGTIRNLRVADASVVGCNDAGCLLGRNYFGNVLDSWASGDVVGRAYAGVLVGHNYYGTVSRCRSSGSSIANGNYAGGLSGKNDHGSISDCHSSASASSPALVGGLLGASSGTVSNCSASGDTYGSEGIGGLIGSQFSGQTSTSFATGDVAGEENVGGLFGRTSGDATNCYALGNVSGTNYVGGLIGEGFDYLTNCFSKGRVSGSIVGGLTGTNHYQVTACFWDMETSGQRTSPEGTGKTTAQMKTRATFTDARWDFSSVWCMLEGVTYPILKWQDAGHPAADAGDDQVVELGTTVGFDGTGSNDDLKIPLYTWTFLDGLEVTMHGDQPMYQFNRTGTFVVTLNVTDISGHWDTDVMNVTVDDYTAPVAEAGSDIVVDEGEIVKFDGSGSTDDDGIVTYTWTFYDGTNAITLWGVAPSHNFSVPGVYTVILSVTDAAGLMGTDRMHVTVRDMIAPIAEAGPDQVIDEGILVTLDGSVSTDNVGIVKYTWSCTLAADTIVTLEGINPTYSFKAPGVYYWSLIVEDAAGHWDSDTMTVTVRDITPPIAQAGPDGVVDEDIRVTFNATTCMDNVGIVNYTWTFSDGAIVFTLYGFDPTHTFTNPGIYEVTLNVTDAVGLWDRDTMALTVKDTTPPVAYAGDNITVDQHKTVSFDGTGSTDNVAVTKWTWSFTYDGTDQILYESLPSFVFEIAGTYQVTIEVRDEAGHVASDNVSVIVLDITPPRSVAGLPVMVYTFEEFTMDGSASTDNVGVVNWTWTVVIRESSIIMSGETLNWTIRKPGDYQVLLTVTDAAGNEDSSQGTIVVPDLSHSHDMPLWIIMVPYVLIAVFILVVVVVVKRKMS